MPIKLKNNKAFTIVEIIVAITVLTIGVLAVATFFGTSAKMTGSSSRISVASNLAQGLIDEKTMESYDSLTPAVGAKENVSSDNSSPFYQYQQKIDVVLIDSNLAESATDVGMKKVVVSIFYNEGSSEKKIEMATIKTKR